ncbi:hypothetical protein SRHO_G00044040 [Serrasalmus rhombeus]
MKRCVNAALNALSMATRIYLTCTRISHKARYKHDREDQAQHIMKILVVHGAPEEDPSDVAIVIEVCGQRPVTTDEGLDDD